MDDQNKKKHLTYSEALAAVGKARIRGMALPVSIDNPPYPHLSLRPATQVKLISVMTMMAGIGRFPGDLELDQTIQFRKVSPQLLDWLEKAGFPVRRGFAPLAADYALIFAGGQRLPHPGIAEKFFGQLIHCMVIETQLLIAMQYFYGMGLDEETFSPAKPRSGALLDWIKQEVEYDAEPPSIEEIQLSNLGQIDFTELYGRVFLDYCVVMIRAQWDKIVRLSCLVFSVKQN